MEIDTARGKACLNQCRIQKYLQGKTVFESNCICDRPNQCWFQLQDHLTEVDPTLIFADVIEYQRELLKDAVGNDRYFIQ